MDKNDLNDKLYKLAHGPECGECSQNVHTDDKHNPLPWLQETGDTVGENGRDLSLLNQLCCGFPQ